MSASVFNPLIISDVRRMRTPGVADRVTDNNRTPSLAALSSLRRNLFGSVNADECKKFIEKEMQQTLTNQSNYWEFDFKNDMPNPDPVRFMWKPTAEKQNARPAKRAYSDYDSYDEVDISHLYFSPVNELSEASDKPKSKTRLHKLKQRRITDFLKNTKASPYHQAALYSKKSLGTPAQAPLNQLARHAHRIKS